MFGRHRRDQILLDVHVACSATIGLVAGMIVDYSMLSSFSKRYPNSSHKNIDYLQEPMKTSRSQVSKNPI
jgi:hypothetical protein